MTSVRVSYGSATPNDALGIICVHYAAVKAIGKGVYSDAVLFAWSPPPEDQRRRKIAELIAQDSTVCTVAECEAKTVGFGIALPAEGWLRALYVHPDHSALGIGTKLLHHIERQCQSAGTESLQVNASHNAEGFYRRHGYELIGPTTQRLTEIISMPAIHMMKRFLRGG